MSAHAFEVLSRDRNEIEVCHTAEGHRFKFFVITNAHARESYLNRSRLLPRKALPYAGVLFRQCSRFRHHGGPSVSRN
jgi:hypothetical protein